MRQWVRLKIETGLRRFLHAEGSYGVLRAHFFRRFFDNDAISPYGDAATSAAQGMMLAACPSIFIAFIVIMGGLFAPLPVGNVHDYFFVDYSFVGMGLLAVFEWQMLFPDKLDFLILTPLPVQPRRMLTAKVEALIRFLGMFLLSANLLGIVPEPGVLGRHGLIALFARHDAMLAAVSFLLAVFAHTLSVLLAGSFAALLVLAIGGILTCVLSPALFRQVLPVAQILIVALLVWVFPQTRLAGMAYDLPMHAPAAFAHWIPQFWFTSVYDWLVMGSSAPQHVRELSQIGLLAWLGTAAVVVLVYPLAWRRTQRTTIEGLSKGGGRRTELLARIGAHHPEDRAVFGFIGQTLRRNQRYQNYLTIYGGVGLAIAGICVVSVRLHGQLGLYVSEKGERAVMPLLLFWLIAGLRAAFDLPVDLGAGWVFAASGIELGRCAAAARRWAALQGMALVAVIVAGLAVAGWDAKRLAVQTVLGASLAMVLADLIFAFHWGIPFTRPRLPGKTNVAILVALYGVAMPYLTLQVVEVEPSMENAPGWLVLPVAIALALRLVLHERQKRQGLVYEVHEEHLDGTLTLGLSQ